MRTRLFAGLALAGLLLLGLPTIATATPASPAPEPATGTGAVNIYVDNYPTQVVEGVPAPTRVFIQGASPQVPVTGTVTVVVEGELFGPFALVDRTAEMVLTFPTPGDRPFEVIYSGDAINAPASVSPSMIVARTSNAVLTVTPEGGAPGDRTNIGQEVAFNVAVTGAGSTPTGQVNFFVNGSEQGRSVLVNGEASYSMQFDSVGARQISAVYMGTGAYAQFQLPQQTLLVTEVPALSLSASAASAAPGDFIELTAQLPADATGTIAFRQSGQTVGSAPVGTGGVAVIRLQLRTPGAASITAHYSGDSRYSPTDSLPLSVEVTAAPAAPVAPSTPADAGPTLAGPSPAASLADTGTPASATGWILLGLSLAAAGLSIAACAPRTRRPSIS